MKKVLELGLPFLIIFSYMKVVSLSGLASVMLIRRWSMLKPLNIVFISDYLDTLIISAITFMLIVLLVFKYRSIQTYMLLITSALCLILSATSYLYYSAILSFLIVSYSVIYLSFVMKGIEFTRILRTFFSVILLVGLLGFSGWILYFTYGGVNPYREPIPLQDIEAKLFYSFSSFVPILVVILLPMPLLIFILKPLTPIEGSKPAEILERSREFLKRLVLELNSFHGKEQAIWSTIFLFISILIPPIFTLALYSENINPSKMIVGVDIMNYVDQISNILSKSPTSMEIFVNMMKTDRPLSLLFIYYSSKLLNMSTKFLSMYAPCFLGPLLAIATYFFGRKIFKNNLYASLTSFMISTGPFTLASLYGGFLANWLGLSIILASITLLLKALEKKSLKILVASIILSIFSYLSHPIPWSFIIGATVIYGLYSSLKKDKAGSVSKFIWVYISTNIFFDVIKTRVMSFSGATLVAQSTIFAELSLENLLNFWQINVFMFYFHVGGAFNFPPTYILAILGMILFLQLRSIEADYLKSWIVIGVPLYLLGPDYFQARTLQNIPVDFFASAGAIMVFYYLSRRDNVLASLFLLLLLILYLNNILRFIANLPF